MSEEIQPTNRIEEKRLKQYRHDAWTAKQLLEEYDAIVKRMDTYRKSMGGESNEHPAQFCHNFLATWAKSQLQ
jgi:hypothetical protein